MIKAIAQSVLPTHLSVPTQLPLASHNGERVRTKPTSALLPSHLSFLLALIILPDLQAISGGCLHCQAIHRVSLSSMGR